MYACRSPSPTTVDAAGASTNVNPALVDAWWVDQRVWGINNSSGATVIEEFRLLQRRSPRLTPATEAAVPSPCQAADGVPSRVAFFTEVTGLVLCEHRILTSRLIARTTDAGANFERLIDSRQGSGLDGEGTIEDLEVAGEENVWRFSPLERASVRRGSCASATRRGRSLTSFLVLRAASMSTKS